MEFKLKSGNSALWIKKIIMCTLSLVILGIGCGINVVTELGADPITVFYEGLSNVTHLTVGMTAAFINTILVITVFCIKRKYINIGTIIYLFILGTFIDFGIWSYNLLHLPNVFLLRLIASLIGCVFCFIGLGGFMSVDIGIDPWTAFALIISEKTGKSFRLVKVICDASTLVIGWLMGGVVGIITLFCAFTGGPIIQKSAEILDKAFAKMIKCKCEK